MAQTFQNPPGTRDFFPDDMALRRYIEDTWRRVSQRHGFVEVDGPTFEYLDLYKVKSGDEIVSQLFHFESRGEDKTQFALRPEFTPTLARMVAARANSLPRPIKWFSIPRCYRAERPQKGRLREFIQWNVDVIGIAGEDVISLPSTDYLGVLSLDCIAVCIDALREFGFTEKDVELRWNNRHRFEILMGSLGIPETQFPTIFLVLDRISKLRGENQNEARKKLYTGSQFTERLVVLCEIIAEGRSPYDLPDDLLATLDKSEISKLELQSQRIRIGAQRLDEQLKKLGFAEFCTFDATLVRGLAYYTGFVFEVVDRAGQNRAIAGGGRYDKLIEMFGGPALPAVGFGMGDVVLENILKEKKKLPTNIGQKPEVFVVSALEDPSHAQEILTKLRTSEWNEEHTAIVQPGISAVSSYKSTKNIGKLLQEAAGSGAKVAVILAPAEWNKEGGPFVKVKNLMTRDEREVALGALIENIRADLGIGSPKGST